VFYTHVVCGEFLKSSETEWSLRDGSAFPVERSLGIVYAGDSSFLNFKAVEEIEESIYRTV